MRWTSLFTLIAACAHGAPVTQIDSLNSLTPQRCSMEEALASKLPTGVSFAVTGAPRREGALITLAARLSNTTATAQRVVIFPVGADGFHLEPVGIKQKPYTGPPRPPPAPPAPLCVDLPAHSEVKMSTFISTPDWEFVAGAPIELKWIFHFWNERPEGRVTLR